jgi:hypothetical protein
MTPKDVSNLIERLREQIAAEIKNGASLDNRDWNDQDGLLISVQEAQYLIDSQKEVERLSLFVHGRKCHVCGEPTEIACADCRIDLGTSVFVCGKQECREKHEQKCPARLRQENERLTKITDDYPDYVKGLQTDLYVLNASNVALRSTYLGVAKESDSLRQSLQEAREAIWRKVYLAEHFTPEFMDTVLKGLPDHSPMSARSTEKGEGG